MAHRSPINDASLKICLTPIKLRGSLSNSIARPDLPFLIRNDKKGLIEFVLISPPRVKNSQSKRCTKVY